MKISQQKEQVAQHERDLDHMHLENTFLPGNSVTRHLKMSS